MVEAYPSTNHDAHIQQNFYDLHAIVLIMKIKIPQFVCLVHTLLCRRFKQTCHVQMRTPVQINHNGSYLCPVSEAEEKRQWA